MRKLIKICHSIFLFLIIIVSCTKVDMTSQTSRELVSSSNAKPYVVQCNAGFHWDYYWKKCMPDCPTGYHNDSITGACVLNGGNPPIIISYAGVNISYYSTNHLLGFNSTSDVNTVLNQLDSDYEVYNTNYENQYPTLTADQLDSVDQLRSFDDVRTFKNFENLFSGYTSKRSLLKSIENTWLLNNYSGLDPDSVDYSFDNAENTIFNNNYQFKVGNSLYEMKDDGLYIDAVLYDAGGVPPGGLSPNFIACYTNKKTKVMYLPTNDPSRKFKLKIAIQSLPWRAVAKSKTVSFKNKNGNRRARAYLAVSCGGTVYDKDCSSSFQFTNRNPTSGTKRRNEMKSFYRVFDANPKYKTKSGELSSVHTCNSNAVGLSLTF